VKTRTLGIGLLQQALCPVLVAFATTVIFRGGDAPARPGDPDVQAFFLAQYPAAARRLAGVLDHATGIVNCKSDRPVFGQTDNPTVRFFKSGPKRRLDITNSRTSTENPIGRKGNRTYLFTPSQAAVVDDPGTLTARVTRASSSPLPSDVAVACMMCWRFVEGAYCYDGHSLAERINDGTWTVNNVAREAKNPEWITVAFSISERRSAGGAEQRQIGNARITFSPGEDWVVRRCHVEHDLPRESVRFELVNDGFCKLQKGYIPKTCHVEIFASDKPREIWKRAERIDYELKNVRTDPVPSSTFTLSDLGIAESKTR
jgi:hypothetical protein